MNPSGSRSQREEKAYSQSEITINFIIESTRKIREKAKRKKERKEICKSGVKACFTRWSSKKEERSPYFDEPVAQVPKSTMSERIAEVVTAEKKQIEC